ncbi:major capsid protein [uncultured Mediterranean phage uvMED]|nr:major capsid protein [uncultured Mediterranean phage uvMED]BAR37051.1 putative major capsid protein [uncultured Mediterranean phage uvMED]
MSVNVTTSFVEQYSANVQMLSQQMGSKLRGAVDVESIKGKNAFFEQIGKVTAQLRTSRHGATPQIDTPHSRRRLNTATYEWADLIDDADKIRMLIDPTSSYAKAAAAAMGRAMDSVIITAALGAADTGVSGGTSTALPSSQKVVHGSAGLTVAKLLSAKKILDENDVDPSVKRYCVVSPEQIEDLLNLTEVKSSDFNTVKALAQGDINSFLGFEFITSNLLTADATPSRQVIAFAADGIKLGIGKDITAKISERDDKSYSTQVYYCMDLGATRMEEEKVVEIACNE